MNATYVFERGTSRSSDDSSRLQAGGFWNDSAVSSHGNSSVHAHKRVVAQKQLVSCMARLVNTVVFLPAALCRGTHRNTIQFATCKRTTHTFFGNGQKVETTPSPAPNKDRPFTSMPGRQEPSGRGRGKHKYEEEIARRWWALPLNVNLPLSNGESCQLLYPGRPGGSPGPDIRDAVLSFTSCRSGTGYAGVNSQQAENAVGDVEIHMRATDWFAHQHHTDVRYNNVVLHIVLICDHSRPTLRQDGTVIPTCSLNDLSSATRTHQPVQWPCHHVIAQIHEEERTHLLTLAGTLRFEMKTQIFFELLHDARPTDIFSAYDVCLIPALAEALGFGRDRAFFRAAGLHLIGAVKTIPEPLGRAPQPSPLDTNRLHMLRKLVEQWRTTGAWDPLRQALLANDSESTTTDSHPRRGGSGVEKGGDACVALASDVTTGVHYSGTSRTPTWGDASVPTPHHPSPAPTRILAGVQKLRNIFDGLGTARTDILICNIVLPFAAAVAQQENDFTLAEYARNLFVTYPGLSSNQITRAMCKQLMLKSEPKGACQQQGLHFIYTQTCREKRCTECLIGKQDV